MSLRFPRRPVVAAFSLACAFAASAPVLAQTFHGAVTGSVTDATGAAISGATVILTNPATDTKLNFTSNKAGDSPSCPSAPTR